MWTALVSAVANIFGWLKDRSGCYNAPDVKAAKIRSNEQDAVDKTNQAIAGKDTNEVQDELAE
jgi:hypothetical protein